MNRDLQEPGKVRVYIAVSGRIDDDVAGKDESTVLYFVHYYTTIYQVSHRKPQALQDFEL